MAWWFAFRSPGGAGERLAIKHCGSTYRLLREDRLHAVRFQIESTTQTR